MKTNRESADNYLTLSLSCAISFNTNKPQKYNCLYINNKT